MNIDYITGTLIASTTLLGLAPILRRFGRTKDNRWGSLILLISFIFGIVTIVFIINWLYFIPPNSVVIPVAFLIQTVTFVVGVITPWSQKVLESFGFGKKNLVASQQSKSQPQDSSEILQLQRLFTQRVLIIMVLSLILFLSFVVAVPFVGSTLVLAIPIVGLIITVIGLIHFILKKSELNQIDPPSGGFQRFFKWRWVAIYLLIAFCVVWVFSIGLVFPIPLS